MKILARDSVTAGQSIMTRTGSRGEQHVLGLHLLAESWKESRRLRTRGLIERVVGGLYRRAGWSRRGCSCEDEAQGSGRYNLKYEINIPSLEISIDGGLPRPPMIRTAGLVSSEGSDDDAVGPACGGG